MNDFMDDHIPLELFPQLKDLSNGSFSVKNTSIQTWIIVVIENWSLFYSRMSDIDLTRLPLHLIAKSRIYTIPFNYLFKFDPEVSYYPGIIYNGN